MTLAPRQRRGRITLIVIAVLFLTPFVLALVLNRLGWHPAATRNHGTLVEPPQPLTGVVLRDRAGGELPLTNLDHRWTLLVRVPVACDKTCQARLEELHRVRVSLGRHAPKLAIRLIAPAVLPPLPETLVPLSDGSVAELAEASALVAQVPDWTGLLVDDKAFLMLRFDPGLPARLLRRDLSRLVK
ncbi:MAG: hypothetical protein KF823_03590 [Xanthomonadales bacterium]|nr:hypothetical protein [Xanthomonadales bacterium]